MTQVSTFESRAFTETRTGIQNQYMKPVLESQYLKRGQDVPSILQDEIGFCDAHLGPWGRFEHNVQDEIVVSNREA